MTAPSIPEPGRRVEFGLGLSDELVTTGMMTVWELMKPSWCPSPNADVILRATQKVERESNVDCNLRDLNTMRNLMTEASGSNREKTVELPGWGAEDWVEPDNCLARTCGLEGNMCGGLVCPKLLSKQHKQLVILFRNLVMKMKTETELIAYFHGGTEMNLLTALGFYSMFGSLETMLGLEHKHEIVTAISVEAILGVLHTEQIYIGRWREVIEKEMNLKQSGAYQRSYAVESNMVPLCRSRYPVHFLAVDLKSTRSVVDQISSKLKCVRFARLSEKSYVLLFKMFPAVPEKNKNELESILGKKLRG